MWKNAKFSLIEIFFREISSLVTSLVKTLLSRNFCQKCVRVNFRNFHRRVVSQQCNFSSSEQFEFMVYCNKSSLIRKSRLLSNNSYFHQILVTWAKPLSSQIHKKNQTFMFDQKKCVYFKSRLLSCNSHGLDARRKPEGAKLFTFIWPL